MVNGPQGYNRNDTIRMIYSFIVDRSRLYHSIVYAYDLRIHIQPVSIHPMNIQWSHKPWCLAKKKKQSDNT